MQFDSLISAKEAGYTTAGKAVIETYRGLAIRGKDVSGANSRGCSYAIIVDTDDCDFDFIAARIDRSVMRTANYDPIRFGASESIWIKADTRFGGAFHQMYADSILKSSLLAAKAAIDQLFNANPTLVHWEESRQAAAARSLQTTTSRELRRANKLAAKFGAANLAPNWQAVLSGQGA